MRGRPAWGVLGWQPSFLYTSLSRSLPSGLSRREQQLAGYTRTLRNTFPEQLWLSVGPVPAGARLASYVCQLNRCSRRDRPDGERDILLSLGSQPVVIPPGQARRKSHKLV